MNASVRAAKMSAAPPSVKPVVPMPPVLGSRVPGSLRTLKEYTISFEVSSPPPFSPLLEEGTTKVISVAKASLFSSWKGSVLSAALPTVNWIR